jgi:hypothetical protein
LVYKIQYGIKFQKLEDRQAMIRAIKDNSTGITPLHRYWIAWRCGFSETYPGLIEAGAYRQCVLTKDIYDGAYGVSPADGVPGQFRQFGDAFYELIDSGAFDQ